MLSKGVESLFIRIKFLPEKYLINPLAGYTVKDVPPTISVSHEDIAFIDEQYVESFKGSSYKTTSGFIIPPQLQ